MNEFITLISAVAALIIAVVTFFVVLEMRKQRLSAFRLDFAVIEPSITGWIRKDGMIVFSSDYDSSNLPTNLNVQKCH